MLEFLIEQGIRMRRLPSWPDHYQQPGGSVPGRAVVSELFDINQLGEWKAKLRPGFLPLPANLDEAMQLPDMKRSWEAKKTLFRVIGRAIGCSRARPLRVDPSLSAAIGSQHRIVCVSLDHAHITSPIASVPGRAALIRSATIT